MFTATMQDSKIFAGIIDILNEVIDETVIKVSKNGMEFTAFDESHICLLNALIPASMFADFKCDGAHEIGVNLEDLYKITKRFKANDALFLKYETESEKITMQAKGTGTRTFTSRVVSVDAGKIPPTSELDVEFDSNATFSINILAEAIKDSEIYADTMEIKLDASGLTTTSEGEVGEMIYNLSQDHLDAIRVAKSGTGRWSLAYLKKLVKANLLADKVTIFIADNAPMKFHVEFETTGQAKLLPADAPKGHVTYYLAPRVPEDELMEE
jgi:proliferating cell nuclear antigen PCNA